MSLFDNKEMLRKLQHTQIQRNRLRFILREIIECLEDDKQPTAAMTQEARKALQA